MEIGSKTKQAVQHTLHCLLGCSIGEIAGMVFTTAFGWPNLANIVASVLLAFFFGYSLTAWSLRKNGMRGSDAIRTAVATDTVSIISMEAVDTLFIIAVPGALSAGLDSSLFWLSLLGSLIVAFIITVPVNRWTLSSQGHAHH